MEHFTLNRRILFSWIPACAGMTASGVKSLCFSMLDSRLRGNDGLVETGGGLKGWIPAQAGMTGTRWPGGQSMPLDSRLRGNDGDDANPVNHFPRSHATAWERGTDAGKATEMCLG